MIFNFAEWKRTGMPIFLKYPRQPANKDTPRGVPLDAATSAVRCRCKANFHRCRVQHCLKNPQIFPLIYYHSWQYPRIELASPNYQIYIMKWAIIRFLHKYWLYTVIFARILNFRLIFLSDAKYIFVIIFKLNYNRVFFCFNSPKVLNCRKS